MAPFGRSFTLHFHFQHCKVTDFFPILQISALDFSRFSAQTPRIEYFLPLLSQEGCPDGRGGLNKGIIPHSDSPPNRGAGEVSLALLQTTPPIGSPPNLGGEEVTLQASLRCLAHLTPMPCAPHSDALHYRVGSISPKVADYRDRPCRLSERVKACGLLLQSVSCQVSLPLCHFATLSILRMRKLPSYKLLYIIIYNNSYYNIILSPSTIRLYFATTLKMK